MATLLGIPFTTLKELTAEYYIVEKEYGKLGLWSKRLDDVDLFLVPIGSAYGWKDNGRDGEIHIPRVSLSKIGEVMYGLPKASLRDVLRHEYGHALADVHRAFTRSDKFKRAFGVSYDDETTWEYDPRQYVSEYATTNNAEDFAETVMYYVKSKGVIPKRWADKPEIRKKWKLVADIGSALRKGKLTW
jgi:hypothetical protein